MCKKFYSILFFLSSCLSVIAQNGYLSDAQRNAQINFIRHDTLPVIVSALPDEINSRFSEYSGRLLKDSIFIFSSMRADVEEDYDHLFETSWYCHLYQSKLLPSGEYQPAIPLPSSINTHNTFNSNYCVNHDMSVLFYTRCTRSGEGELHCSLWQSNFNKGKWSKPQKLPSSINAEGSSSMQPHLVSNGENEILYFVSDRKQGMGGFDIWYSVLKDGHFSPPVNAGPPVNTEGNEITPFYDQEKHILYFSSDEHLGIGDYDIFYSIGALSQWNEVSNMGVPFNSDYNDYYFTLNSDGQSGYFSSNRPHDDMASSDTCCNDLFHFQWEPTIQTDSIIIPDTNSISQKIASLLPITLYFQNDEPNPKSISDTTEYDYPTLYKKYVADNNLYISESGRGLHSNKQDSIQKEMSQFLRDSVSTSYARLLQLTQYLKDALLSELVVELTIDGYASPLHHSDYNTHLSSRRITSLLNYLYSAENHFFTPYLLQEKTGLIIHTNPQGAIQHDFQTTDIRETVFGIQAAKDRKIEIRGKVTFPLDSSTDHH